jgi:DMSO/TMAO reductase YedYZ molybdopterin-dependent catalytic subunit
MDKTDRPEGEASDEAETGETAQTPSEAAADPGVKGETAETSARTDTPAAADAESRAPAASPTKTEAPREAPTPAAKPVPRSRRPSLALRLAEPEETTIELPASTIRTRTRRDFLLLGAGALAAAGGLWWLLPDETRQEHLTPRLREWLDSAEARLGGDRGRRERFLNRVLTFDDDVAEALYSPTRSVRTYSKSQVTALRNNYNGGTPKPDYIPGWTLAVSGLASGRVERLPISDLLSAFARHDQVTRICCVEGWSAIAWWGGVRFSDLLEAYPPMPGARWAKLVSSVNVDSSGNPDPYYVSIDLPTARHPQTLLATHFSGRPLPLEHGAPMRLLAPMKLGLKNIKAVTSIAYSVEEPADYWAERGYSKYDGL